MDVYKKNVFKATKCICKSFDKDSYVCEVIEKNAVFVKVGHNDYREVTDLWKADCPYLPTFINLKDEMPHYHSKPTQKGDFVIEEKTPFYNSSNLKEKTNLNSIIFEAVNDHTDNLTL